MSSVDAPPGAVNAGTPIPPIPADVFDVEQLDIADLLDVARMISTGRVSVEPDVADAVMERVLGLHMVAQWHESRNRRASDVNITPDTAPVSEAPLPTSCIIPGPENFDTAGYDPQAFDPSEEPAPENENVTPDETPEPEVIPPPPTVTPTTPEPDTRPAPPPLDGYAIPRNDEEARALPDHIAAAILARRDRERADLWRSMWAARAAERPGVAAVQMARDLEASFKAVWKEKCDRGDATAVRVKEVLDALIELETAHRATQPTPPFTPMTAVKWCIVPQTEVDAWAISAKGADMLFSRFEADHARVTAEVPPELVKAEWDRRRRAGEVVAFTEEVFGIVSGRAQDVRENVQKKYRLKPPEHLKERIDARRKELWRASMDRRSGRTRQPAAAAGPKKVKAQKKRDTKKPRLWQKTDQLREFREHAAEWGVVGLTQLVWRELWDAEGWVARRQWIGHTAVTQADLIERLGIGETKLKETLKELEKKCKLLEKVKDERKGVSAKVYRITFRPGYWDWIPDQGEMPDGVSEAE